MRLKIGRNWNPSPTAREYSQSKPLMRANSFHLCTNGHQNNDSQQVVLFFLDGLDKISEWDETLKSQFRWLLMRGPSRRVWPILTLNSTMIGDAKEWFSLFKTFIYGKISNPSLADVLTGAGRANLGALREGVQFSMKEGNHWLRFWIPNLT